MFERLAGGGKNVFGLSHYSHSHTLKISSQKSQVGMPSKVKWSSTVEQKAVLLSLLP
jgi:hypothetical protein